MTCSNEEHRTLLVRRCSPQAVGAGPEAVQSEGPATGRGGFSVGRQKPNKIVLITKPHDEVARD